MIVDVFISFSADLIYDLSYIHLYTNKVYAQLTGFLVLFQQTNKTKVLIFNGTRNFVFFYFIPGRHTNFAESRESNTANIEVSDKVRPGPPERKYKRPMAHMAAVK